VIDSNGNVTAAIIGLSGGFLGANQKDVVIPFKELKVSTRDGRIPRASIGLDLVSVAVIGGEPLARRKRGLCESARESEDRGGQSERL
jgi:hypothetical protein